MSLSRMVALGSSFAAGPGIEPVVDRAAGRSGRNYAHLVAAELGATLVDASVSGATTETLLRRPQRVGLRRFPPQVEQVTADADLVTITAGGNDLGYLGGVLSTALLGRLAQHRTTAWLARYARRRRPLRPVGSDRKDAATSGLVAVVEAVASRAPQARVVLVDYLPVFSDASAPSAAIPLTAQEIEHFRGVAAVLSEVFAEASRRTGCDLVPASRLEPDHGAGSPVPWVESLRGRRLGSSFHPNQAGMRAVADHVLAHLREAGVDV